MIGTYAHQGFHGRYIGAFQYEEIAVDGTVVALTEAYVDQADFIFLQVGDGPIRVTCAIDTTPTSTFGLRMWDSDNTDLSKYEARNLRATRDSVATGNGVLRAHYYKMNMGR